MVRLAVLLAVAAVVSADVSINTEMMSADRKCGACDASTFSTGQNARACIAVKACDPGSRVTLNSTLSSDRVCEACVHDVSYQSKPNQEKCLDVSLCSAGQRESSSPTVSTNRECKSCGSGTYQPASNHKLSSCQSHTVCARGTYTATPGTSTADAICEACKAETYQDQPGQASCKKASRCPAGQRASAPPTATSDRVCIDCVLGSTYMDETGHISKACKDVTLCRAGKFEEIPPTLASDAVCKQCALGSYQDEDDKTSCKLLTPCKDTEYISTHHTHLADQKCSSCRIWDNCASKEWLKGSCGGATGDENPTCEPCHATCATCSGPGAEECASCVTSLVLDSTTCVSDCRVGYYVDTQQTCRPCHITCYECSGSGRDQCLQCTSDLFLQPDGRCLTTCPDSMWQRTVSENDQVCATCTVCTGGTWSATVCQEAADTVCEPWRVCKPGEETKAQPSATSNRQCQSCVQSKNFSPAAGTEDCQAVTVCSFPDKEGVAPTLTSDRECTCDVDGCAALVRTVYLDLICRQPDTNELSMGVHACCNGVSEADLDAELRQRSIYTARHSCPGCTVRCGCTAGYYSAPLNGGGNTCEPCNGVTLYQPFEGQSACLPVTTCDVGEQEKFAPSLSADRICETCPHGYVDADRNGSTRCTACALHETYSDTRGRTTCLSTTVCVPGHEEDVPATLSTDRTCVACKLGATWKANAGRETNCVSVASCDFPASEWLSTEATLSTDVACTPLTRCDYESEYRYADATLRSDTECQPLTQCDVLETEFIRVTKTEASDRECSPLTTCVEGTEWESHAPTATTDRICVTYTVCDWNQYDIVKATPTSDRACVNVWVADLFSPLPRRNATFTGVLSWSEESANAGQPARRRRRDGLEADAVGQATWEAVQDAALQQLATAWDALGVNSAVVVTTELGLVDQSGNMLSAIDQTVVDTTAIRIRVRVTDENVWRRIISAAASGLEGASQARVDWPLLIEPCLPEFYLAGGILSYSNGTVLIPCQTRTQCVLGVTWAAYRGNTTQDRSCLAARTCTNGEAVPPTLTSDRKCQAESATAVPTGAVAALGALGAILAFLVLALLVVYQRRQLQRERDRTNASFGGTSKTQISFVNPSFRGQGQDNALYEDEGGRLQSLRDHPLYDDASPLNRVMSNPLYGGSTKELFDDYDRISNNGEALYDEVHAVESEFGLSPSDDEPDEYIDVAGSAEQTYGRGAVAQTFPGAPPGTRTRNNPAYESPGGESSYFDVKPVSGSGGAAGMHSAGMYSAVAALFGASNEEEEEEDGGYLNVLAERAEPL